MDITTDTQTTSQLDQIDAQIIEYLNAILIKKGVDGLPKDVLIDMLLDLYSRFEQYIFVSLMKGMDPETYAQFDAFIASDPTPEQSITYLKEKVPNLDQVIRETMDEFEMIYLGDKR